MRGTAGGGGARQRLSDGTSTRFPSASQSVSRCVTGWGRAACAAGGRGGRRVAIATLLHAQPKNESA